MNAVTIPWPSPVLSPNSRAHWRRVAQAKAQARNATRVFARSNRLRAPDGDGPIAVSIVAHPPTGWRTGDRDNFLARLKAHLDGLAEALGVNDARFRPSLEIGERRGRGEVVITVQEVKC